MAFEGLTEKLSAAFKKPFNARSPRHIQCSHSLWGMHLVRAHGICIHAQLFYIHLYAHVRLHSVTVEYASRRQPVRQLRQLLYGVYNPRFVVHVHYAYKRAFIIQFIFQRPCAYNTVSVNRQHRYPCSARFHPHCGLIHRRMLGCGYQNAVPLP